MAESEQTSRDSAASNTSSGVPIAPQLTQTTTETSLISITCHKLNGHNYLQWSQSMMMFISGRSRDDYLTGATTQPNSSDLLFRS